MYPRYSILGIAQVSGVRQAYSASLGCAPMSSLPRVHPLGDSLRTRPVEVYPASLAQQRLWFLNELQAPTGAYNVNIGLWFYGPLDLAALQASVQAIVDRHESLRTTFALEGGELVQLVEPRLDVLLPLTDFSALEKPYPPAYEFAKREVEEPFDLGTGPLFRARILRIAPEEHVFLCTMHHTVTDSWSMQLFTKELAAFYAAITNGSTAALPDLGIQYGDFAEWQRRLFDTEFAQKQLAYWKRTLDGVPALLELPTDTPRPAEQTLRGSSHTFPVPAEIITSVAPLATRQRVTTFMLLLAAFKALLYRYSSQPDVCVGVPVAGRTRLETEPLIGFFVDTLVFRDDLSGNPRFVDLLAQVRETTLGALANADVPFEKVVEVLRPERNLSYNPVFQVMFSVIKSAIRSHAFGNIVAYPYVVDASSSILDLCATFIEDSDGKWWLQIDFDTSLFNLERISRMFEDYMDLLRQVIAQPEMRIDDPVLRHAPAAMTSKVISQQKNIAAQTRREGKARPVATDHPISATVTKHELFTEIWKDVLGVKDVDIHDNFFDIGGHSLLAAHLTAEIQKATGRRIPVSAIFRAPTIESLATLVYDDALQAPDPVLMQLSQGESQIPFFAVAAPGVDSLGYALLARNLGPQHSVYKLQAAGTGIWERPLEKEELHSLARQYISAMRSVQPHGPFCLGGMCNGVLIAQEMIRQLESQGEQVALFAILDTWVLENSQVKSLWAVHYYKERLRMLPRLPLREQMAIMGRLLKRVGIGNGAGKTRWAQAYWPDEGFQTPRFAAPVLLFKRPRQPFFYVRDPEMGWGARSAGGVEICEVNCGHYELLRQPHVLVVAERLLARLQEVNEQAREQVLPFPGPYSAAQSDLHSSIAQRAV